MRNAKCGTRNFGHKTFRLRCLPVSLSPCLLVFLALFLCVSAVNLSAQEPKPGPARTVNIPAVKETKLKNGLTVAVVERRNTPLVSVGLMVNSGYTSDDIETAGLAQTTATLLTKGTKNRTATQIASEAEFLGSSIIAVAGADETSVSFLSTSDKLTKMMDIFADVVLRPSFPQTEIDLAKSQAIDELTYNLTQPGFLAHYVASVYSLHLTPSGGTPASLESLNREAIVDYYNEAFLPDGATILFVGDIDSKTAFAMSERYFGSWKKRLVDELEETPTIISIDESSESVNQRTKEFASRPLLNRILVIDLPESGQAYVSYVNHIQHGGRIVWNDKVDHGEYSKTYFPALVLNSVLGGGYSSRLNNEIRIKRGLSYGAGSNISWRAYDSRFTTRTQTKNDSAAEVAELVLAELQKLKTGEVGTDELIPRKAVLTGSYGRSIETSNGIIGVLAGLYSNWLPPNEMNNYIQKVNEVTGDQIRSYAVNNFAGGDIIIVGDYSIFKDDLAKRFPNIKPEVIPAAELDITKPGLRK